MIEADGSGTPLAVTVTLHACVNDDAPDAGHPIDATKAPGGGGAVEFVTVIVALEADAADDDTVAVYTPALPYVCVIENAVDCSIAPSPNDQVHVAPTALELTLNRSGTPVVPFPDTFKKETGNVGAGTGAGPLVGTTRVCALSSCPTDAVTSAVSLAVSVADAIPLALVGT